MDFFTPRNRDRQLKDRRSSPKEIKFPFSINSILATSEHKPFQSAPTSGTFNLTTWINDRIAAGDITLNFVTLDTPQEITAEKTFSGFGNDLVIDSQAKIKVINNSKFQHTGSGSFYVDTTGDVNLGSSAFDKAEIHMNAALGNMTISTGLFQDLNINGNGGNMIITSVVEALWSNTSRFALLGIPTHADDAAAGTAGRVAGDLYKTATGEVRIKL